MESNGMSIPDKDRVGRGSRRGGMELGGPGNTVCLLIILPKEVSECSKPFLASSC